MNAKRFKIIHQDNFRIVARGMRPEIRGGNAVPERSGERGSIGGSIVIDVKTTIAVDPRREDMVRVTFVLNGRETIVTEDGGRRPTNSVDRVMLLAARNHVQRRLAGIRCPFHGEPPSVIATGPAPDRLQFSVQGCCDRLVERATHALEPLTGEGLT